MGDTTSNLIIDENELKESDQIVLYKELIRILERDIDDAQSRNSREGWNTWGILGAIVGAALLLLGQTKDLTEVPTETKTITITFILLFQFIFGAYNLLTGNQNFVKKQRLIDSKEVYSGRKFLFFIRFSILSLVSFGIYTSDYLLWVKIVSIFLILTPVLFMVLPLFLSSYTQIFIGNTPQNQKAKSIGAYAVLTFYLTATVLLGYQLQFPVGQVLSAAYMIGLSISAIIILGEVLLSNSTSTDAVAGFQDLRDDIIFRRASLNESLNRYLILKEGKSLYDEMKGDLDRIMNYLHREEEIYGEQKKILKKLNEFINSKDESEDKLEEINDQTGILTKSFETYTREMGGLISLVVGDLDPFFKKLKKAANASGDYETEDVIRRLINQKLNQITEKEREITGEKTNLIEQANKLNSENPANQKPAKKIEGKRRQSE